MSLNYIPSVEKSSYTRMVQKSLDIHEQYPDDFRKARYDLINYWDHVRKNDLKITDTRGSLSESLLRKKRERFLLGRGNLPSIAGVHVLPNIGIMVLSMLYGTQDDDPLGKSICVAAMMGLDTDCNCGNIGAILGAQLGADKIPSKWKDPLQDTFSTYVKGYEKWKISGLAKRISEIGKKMVKEKCQLTKIL